VGVARTIIVVNIINTAAIFIVNVIIRRVLRINILIGIDQNLPMLKCSRQNNCLPLLCDFVFEMRPNFFSIVLGMHLALAEIKLWIYFTNVKIVHTTEHHMQS